MEIIIIKFAAVHKVEKGTGGNRISKFVAKMR